MRFHRGRRKTQITYVDNQDSIYIINGIEALILIDRPKSFINCVVSVRLFPGTQNITEISNRHSQ